MKFISSWMALIVLMGLTISASAEYVQIKTADGYYTREYRRPARTYYPYVCYDRRIEVYNEGLRYLKYEGCIRSKYKCKSIDMVHFGRYPSNRASSRALRRCKTATPRFID